VGNPVVPITPIIKAYAQGIIVSIRSTRVVQGPRMPTEEHDHDGGKTRPVSLHGAGGSARQGLDLLRPVAAEHGLLVVAPQSSGVSWDLIHGGFGPDVRRLDRVLGDILDRYPVAGMVIGGFSDGASYALSLGLSNGDIFDAVLAFSPGFAAPGDRHGNPRIFVSHGTGDRVLPIEQCSRRLVPMLRAIGYDVTYEEFAGGHEVPARLVQQAAAWLSP
jgi:predicted esterase